MRSTFAVLFYLNKAKTKKNGLCPIMGRITIDGTIAQFSIKLDADPNLWDAKLGCMTGKTNLAITVNRKIETISTEINTIYKQLVDAYGYVTAERVKNGLLGIGVKADTLLKLFREHNQQFEKRIGIDRTESTMIAYQGAYKHLEKFIKHRYNKDDYPLKQLNYSFINDFDFYLRVEKGINSNSILNRIIALRKMINRAINEGTLLRDPFVDYVPDKPKRKRRHLSNEEIEKLMTTVIDAKGVCFVRDMFVFSIFTGLSYIDICNLTEKHLVTESDGSLWIMTHRQKTGGESNIRLLDIPIQIIEKYKSKRKSDKLFNMINKTSIGRNLRKVEMLCKIDTHLEFHMGRHSFATQLCLSQGVPMETVCRMMGHKSVRTTQIYAKITNQKVDNDMKALSSRIGGKYSLLEDNMQVGLSRNKYWK